VDGLMNG